MLDQAGPESISIAVSSDASAGRLVKVTLRMSAAHAVLLARRARAADVAQGRYVCSLLDGVAAPPLAADHGAVVATLRASTDRVAAMSADLNAFLRLLDRLPSGQLEGHRAGLTSLASDMRSHLAKASALIAELAPSRRCRK
ncbi:hypothetical protein ACG04R_27875 [Roseateles sp. BYS78W]|uniref:Uncharacterized protein n=1 Tax=Pelomonas candidula TaxID=3299025 RepID=A0ABW7HKQ4_9BURK